MGEELVRMQRPGESAPVVTDLVAHCKVCGSQWQIRGSPANTVSCSFCDAPPSAIRILSENPRTRSLALLG